MKIKYLILAALVLLLPASCGKKQSQDTPEQRNEFIRPASINFTKEDTSEVMALVNHYVSCMKSKDYDNAFRTLYYLSGKDSVKPLTAEERAQAVNAYKHLPIHDCAVTSFSLKGESENVIKVGIQLTEHGNIADGVGVTYIGLRPVKVGNKWYLTFLDNDALRVKEM